MLSEQAQLLFDEIRRAKDEASGGFNLEQERRNSSHAGVLTGEPTKVEFDERPIAGLRTIVARPANCHPRRKLIFLHGGGFALMSPATHSRFAGHIAAACRAEVFIPDYSLAPEHPFPQALEECAAFTRRFTESREFFDGAIVLAGDSAGGGLALSAAMKLRDEGRRLPACLALLCPWLDLTLRSESIERNRERALFLRHTSLEAFANLYVTDADELSHPYASPIYGSLRGLPPIYLQGAEHDMLVDDSTRLQELARAEGAPLRYDLFPLMPHSFQFFAGTVPEADAAIHQLGRHIDRTAPPESWAPRGGSVVPS
ncbi:MAG: alpha/beta hydrolase [Chloroflexi bacterium]|nr:alpha/beta hydrolase [Chloroflexota bacterium]